MALMARFSPSTGQYLVVVEKWGIRVFETAHGKEAKEILNEKIGEITAFEFSPADKYLVTCYRYSKGQENL